MLPCSTLPERLPLRGRQAVLMFFDGWGFTPLVSSTSNGVYNSPRLWVVAYYLGELEGPVAEAWALL